MAFDFGLRQFGVAVGNRLLCTAQPLPVIRARDGIPDWESIGQLIAEWDPEVLVVGDPLNMDGTVGPLGEQARRFARRLQGRFDREVELCDERLSSFEAKQQARAQGHRGDYRARPVDSDAATLILQTWMAEHPLPPAG